MPRTGRSPWSSRPRLACPSGQRLIAVLFSALIVLTSAEGIAGVEAQRQLRVRELAAPSSVSGPNELDPAPRNQAAPPSSPSGAFAPYPLNHTLDAYPLILQNGPENWDFETPGYEVGTPPVDFDLESSASNLDLPTNYDFATGDLTGWTATTGVSVGSGGPDGSFGQLANTTGSALTTDAFTVSTEADAFVFDYGTVTSGGALMKVFALTSATFTTSTQIASVSCLSGCTWAVANIAAMAYRGQTIKLKFERDFAGAMRIDRVRTVDLATGWDLTGTPQLVTHSGDQWLQGAHEVVTPAFTVASDAEYATVTAKHMSGTVQRDVYILSGASYATSTRIGYFQVTTGELAVRIPVYPWAGQSVRLKLGGTVNGTMAIDDVAVQQIVAPGWTLHTPSYNRSMHAETGRGVEHLDGPDGADGYDPGSVLTLTTDDDMDSAELAVPAGAQQLILMHRDGYTGGFAGSLHLKALSGAGFATVTSLTNNGTITSPDADWGWLAVPIAAFAGQTIKLRLEASFRILLNDIGFIGQVAPGWSPQTGGSAITVRYDPVSGTYLQAENTTAGFIVTSSPLSLGIVDATAGTDGRSIALGYQFGAHASSSIAVSWVPLVNGVAQTAQTVYFAAAGSTTNTAYMDARFTVLEHHLPTDANGLRVQTGYYKVTTTNGARFYQIADNVARQQRSEPFTMRVGAGVDAVTGSFNWTENDLSVTGGPLPLILNRYYAGHADRLGPLGYRWRHSFDTQLYIGAGQTTVAVLFADGREEAFERTNSSSPYVALDGRIQSTLVQNNVGGVLSYTYTTKLATVYEFNDKGQLIHLVDPNGNTLDFVYDGNDRLSTVTTTGSRTLTFSYDANGRLAQVSGPESLLVSYTYSSRGDLIAVDKPDSQRSEYTYSRHRLRHLYQKVQTGPGQPSVMQEVAANKLDDYNRVTRQTDASGVDIQIRYQHDWATATDANGVTSVKDRSQSGAITRYDFDHFGRIAYVTSPEGVVTQFIFDAVGNLETWIDGNGGEYSFTYNGDGDVTSITDPLNNVRNITINPQHLPTEVDDGLGNITKNSYDAKGNLTQQIVDYGVGAGFLNLTTDYEYDPGTGYLLAVEVDPAGLALRTEYTYDSSGNINTRTVDPAGLDLTWEYAYNARGQLVLEVDPSGLRKRYTYTVFGRIETTIVDPATKADLSSWGDPTGTQHLNLESRYVFDFGGKLTATMDPICTAEFVNPQDCQSEWYYNALGLVTDKYDTTDVRTSYTYDDTGQMTEVVQDATMPTLLGTEQNLTTSYAYDADGRLERVTVDPDDGTGDPELNLVTEYSYDAAGRLETEIVDPADLALTTTYGYDAKGRLMTKQTPGLTGIQGWSYGYDDADRLLTTTDPLGRVTANQYDGAGRLTATIVDPTDSGTPATELDLTTSYAYDAASRVVRTTAPDGLVTETEYDAASRTIRTTVDPDDGTGAAELDLETDYTYYPNGALATTTDPAGLVTTRYYDRAGRLDSIMAPGGRETSYVYDRNSRLISTTSPEGVVTEHAYDLMGRRTETVVDPTGLALTSETTYDRLGRQTAVENARGFITSTAYDAAGRVTSLTDALSPAGVLEMSYDDAGRLTDVTNPLGRVTHSTYDDAGNQLTSTAAHGTGSARTWSYEYDLTGSMTRQLDPNGNDLRYTYDRIGRLAEIWTPGTPNVTYASYAYDDSGRTTGVTNYNGAVSYSYDAVGRVEEVTSPEGTVAYTYNDLGQRTSMNLPGNRTVSYGYDPITADLATIDDWSTAPGSIAVTYDDDGRLEEVRRPTVLNTPTEDIVSIYAYDTAGRLDGLSHSQDSVYLAEYGYTLDANGNRTRIDITGTAVPTGYEAYTYDALDRVDYARYVDGGTATFGYDANGNRTTVSAGGVTTTYGYDTLGQLTSIADNAGTPLDLSLTYDLNGNRIAVTDDTTSTVTRSYAYDWDNRLTEATVSGTATDYAYLGDDTRQSTTVGATSTDYLYDRTAGLPQVLDDGTSGYLHDVTGNLASIDGSGEATYPLQDGLGSVRLTVNDSGTALGAREWDAWGNLRTSTGSGYGFGWAGEQYDASSDLTYLRARYYSPGTAQFLSRDTVQPNAPGTTGYNPYSYANGNPVTFTDPSGHFVSYEEFGGGPFAYLAYVFSCYLGGTCFYHGEHATIEWELEETEQVECTAASLTETAAEQLIRQIVCPVLPSLDNLQDQASRIGGFIPRPGGGGGGSSSTVRSWTTISPSQLSASQNANYFRFLKSLPANSQNITITRGPNGILRFSGDSPARNIPGSYSQYVKVVGSDGRTITFYKITYGPNGEFISWKIKYPETGIIP